VLGGIRREPAEGLLELPLAGDRPARRLRVMVGDGDVDEALEEVALGRPGHPPGVLEGLVRGEPLARRELLEAALVRVGHVKDDGTPWYAPAGVATILVAGVDLYFRGKLDALLAREHKLVTTDSVHEPDLVIVDIARVKPEEVADAYPDVPILGFTNHTDTAGLRAAHAAGFDQVVVRSALAERAPEIVRDLVT
jgi:hypothetical protein